VPPFTKYCEVRHNQTSRRSVILNWRPADRVWPIWVLVEASRIFQNELRIWPKITIYTYKRKGWLDKIVNRLSNYWAKLNFLINFDGGHVWSNFRLVHADFVTSLLRWMKCDLREETCLRRRVAKCNKSRVRLRSAAYPAYCAYCLCSEEYNKPLFYALVLFLKIGRKQKRRRSKLITSVMIMKQSAASQRPLSRK